MELSRITRGGAPSKSARPVDLTAVVRSAVDGSGLLISAARCGLAILIPGEPILVQADPAQLEQAVAKLLNDAARYTVEGADIRVTLGREDADAVVSIHDSGSGIAAEILSKAFEVFTRQAGGLEVRSDGADNGSEFVVRLPLSRAPVPARPLRDD
jgi:signal transduction histidine kinase